MSLFVVVNTFTNGTVADGTQVNANFASIVASGNNINSTNIGSLGIYASQVIPTSTAQSTFGGVLPYYFPSTVYSALAYNSAGGSFSWNTTMTGSTAIGTMGASTTAVGAVTGSLLLFGTTNVVGGSVNPLITIDTLGSMCVGNFLNVLNTTTLSNGLVVNNSPATFNVSVNLASSSLNVVGGTVTVTNLGSYSNPGGVSNGDGVFQRSASTGAIIIGGATSAGKFEYGITNTGAFSARNAANTGYVFGYSSNWVSTSDASLKRNVTPISGALDKVKNLRPSLFDWISDDRHDAGFIAQEVEPMIPEAVHTDSEGIKGLSSLAILSYLVAAFQEYVRTHP